MTSVIARIALRYGAGALLGPVVLQKFGIDPNVLANDPDVQMMVAGGIAAVCEGWTLLAHRFGWKT